MSDTRPLAPVQASMTRYIPSSLPVPACRAAQLLYTPSPRFSVWVERNSPSLAVSNCSVTPPSSLSGGRASTRSCVSPLPVKSATIMSV